MFGEWLYLGRLIFCKIRLPSEVWGSCRVAVRWRPMDLAVPALLARIVIARTAARVMPT